MFFSLSFIFMRGFLVVPGEEGRDKVDPEGLPSMAACLAGASFSHSSVASVWSAASLAGLSTSPAQKHTSLPQV
jgi:hypothetical protein